MANKEILNKETESIFSKIKNWFKGIFGKKETPVFEEKKENVEFSSQKNVADNEIQELNENQNKLQYEFSSSDTVSKQKIDKFRLELDKGKIGFEELYQLSDNEIEELNKNYDIQLQDIVSKLKENSNILEGYNRKIAKIQNLNT